MIDQHLLRHLSKKYPNVKAATEEIVNLNAILSLPKGTEYFLSDLHGEHEAFIHMLKSASGVIRREIGKNVKLRHVPELSFKIDNSIEYGRHMSKIIDSLGIDKYDNNDDSEERIE